ncbi:cytochrome P450 1A1-like [Montipora foliosa]|uniref:cytochrome P450 1A1-like n=1 Tax=Montipora foliosa TaxID=591990 RepID=UPI0035F213D5
MAFVAKFLFGIEEFPSVGQIVFLCCLMCVLLFGKEIWEHSASHLPPGPWGLPVIGASFRIGKNPHLDFTKMAKEYGDVFSLMLGNRLVVVINGVQAIRETIIKRSIAFAGRPKLHTFNLANPKGSSLSFGDYSPRWNLTRKISVGAIHNFVKNEDTLEEKLLHESKRLVHCFKKQKGKAVDALITLKCATANIILNALFGVERSYDDEGLLKILHLAENHRKAVHGNGHVDFLPLLKYLPNTALKNLVLTMKVVLQEVFQMYEKNKETYQDGQVRNIADSFINVVEKESQNQDENLRDEKESPSMTALLKDDQIVSVLADLFGAGFETSSTELYWSLAYLITYPNIQRDLQEELDRVIGRERLPTLQDIPSLPLLQAAVYELLRVSCIVPLAVPRTTTSEIRIRDFIILKDTMVFVNLWSVHHDAQAWKDPHVFNPRRFLDSQGHLIDPKLLGGFLPFSGGRRKCPGEALAKKIVCVFLAVLLHSFRFTQVGLPTEYQGIDLQGEYGLILSPKKFFVSLELRN